MKGQVSTLFLRRFEVNGFSPVFQIGERSPTKKDPRKLASWPDKLNGKLKRIWKEPHQLTP